MIYSETFYVGYSDTNCALRLSNTAILRIFENISSVHSTAAGDGMEDSAARWFLTAYRVRVHHRPANGERISARTWSRELRGFSSCREFEIYDESGKLAVTGISNWARINPVTGRPEKLTPEQFERYGSEPERSNFGAAWIGRIKEPEAYALEKSYYIDRNLIDANRHMNNVFYLELAMCILPDEVYENAAMDDFEIAYRKSIAYGETVKCCYAETADDYVIAFKSENGAETRAIIQIAKKARAGMNAEE